MRLLYVCSDFGIPPTGTKGASIHLRAITRALCALGHDVDLLSPRGGPGDDHPVGCVPHTGEGSGKAVAKALKAWLVSRDLDETVARELRCVLYNAQVSARAVSSLEASPPDAIVERLSLFGHIGVDLATAFDVPLIVEVNAILTDEARRFRSLQLVDLAAQIEHRVLHHADAVLAVSAPLASRLAAMDIPRDRIHTVPNGVDIDAFASAPARAACRERLGLNGDFVVGFVGSLKPWHGVDVLVSAFARAFADDCSARLAIVGSGPELESLRSLCASLHVSDAVRFVGSVPHGEVPSWVRAMDVAVVPSPAMQDFYFSPLKLFEYMACGTCVAASNIGQVAEVIQDGVTGMLCHPGDEQDLCRVLTTLRRSPVLRDRLGTNALRIVRDYHSWDDTARTVSRIIEHAASRRAVPAAARCPRTARACGDAG